MEPVLIGVGGLIVGIVLFVSIPAPVVRVIALVAGLGIFAATAFPVIWYRIAGVSTTAQADSGSNMAQVAAAFAFANMETVVFGGDKRLGGWQIFFQQKSLNTQPNLNNTRNAVYVSMARVAYSVDMKTRKKACKADGLQPYINKFSAMPDADLVQYFNKTYIQTGFLGSLCWACTDSS